MGQAAAEYEYVDIQHHEAVVRTDRNVVRHLLHHFDGQLVTLVVSRQQILTA